MTDITVKEIDDAMGKLMNLAVQYQMSDTHRDVYGAEYTANSALKVLGKVRVHLLNIKTAKKTLRKAKLSDGR